LRLAPSAPPLGATERSPALPTGGRSPFQLPRRRAIGAAVNRRTTRRLQTGGALALALAGAIFLARFSDGSTATEPQDPFGYAPRADADSDSTRDLLRSGVRISGELGGWTYAEYDAERDARSVDSFHGFACLDSCDGLEAGWRWAREEGIGDPIDCTGNSWPFIEGCAAYAAQIAEPADDGDRRPELGLF
jgi:hypothetical protein